MAPHPPKKPLPLPVLNPEPADEEAWEEEDEAVPHPEASAAPEVERAFLHSFAKEAREMRVCCEEMETQLGFSRTQPVVIRDGDKYFLPSPTGNPGVIPTVGAEIRFCPWCAKPLGKRAQATHHKPQGHKKKFKKFKPRGK